MLENGVTSMQKMHMLDNSNMDEKISRVRKTKRCTPSKKCPILKKTLKKYIPILNWISKYDTNAALSDFIAGVTLGLTIIPESIACALLAGLPPIYGLYSAIIGPIIYLIFGSISKVIIGPTSLVALVSVQFTIGKPVEFAILLTFFSGVMQVIMSFCKMGLIFDFISMTVIKAFSSATAVLVMESQMKVYLGINYVAENMFISIKTLKSKISFVSFGDICMGIFATVFLIMLEKAEKLFSNFFSKKFLIRYLSYSRNTLIVLITSSVAALWSNKNSSVPFALSESTMKGLPNFTLPHWHVETSGRVYTIWEIFQELNMGVVIIPFVGILTNLSIGKLDSKGILDNNQELFTVGLCNIFGSFFQSMPTSGAFTRYAISVGCNLRTPMANLYLSIVVLVAMSFLRTYFMYIPKATLAAILVCSIYSLIDFKLPIKLWRESKKELFVWLICFCCSVIKGVDIGLLVSIIINFVYLLHRWARPQIIVKIKEVDEMQFICVTPESALYFPALSYLRKKIFVACEQAEFKIPLVIDCQKISDIDYTVAIGISRIAADISERKEVELKSCLLILYRMQIQQQKLIYRNENIVFCESMDLLCELLTQESLKSGNINLKDHIRASIDLGYNINVAN